MSTDIFLDKLVEQAEEGLVLGIVLLMSGAAVSGQLTSRREYFAEIAQAFSGAACKTTGEPYSAAEQRELYESVADYGRYDESEEQGQEREFLHLREVTVFVGNNHLRAPLWRGRVADVTGYILGDPAQ